MNDQDQLMDDTEMRERNRLLEVMHELRIFLDANPHLPAPYSIRAEEVTWMTWNGPTTRALARAMNATEKKKKSVGSSPELNATVTSGVTWTIIRLDLTCEKVPTGRTETVTKPVVVQDAVIEEREVEEEVYETVCPPVLSD